MAKDLKVGGFAAAPGSKVVGLQEVEAAGHSVEMPVFLINGSEAGHALVVTAGVHGAEYASIEAAF